MENNEVKHMQPQKTWFFEDSDGRVFSTNEKEADSLLTSNSGWRRQDIKMIGMSDGSTYYKYINDSKDKIIELEKKLKEKKAVLNRYVAGHDKLLFDEFAEDDDPRVSRAKKKIEETEKEIEPIEAEYKDLRKNVIKKAEEAELEVARGNMVRPKSFKVIQKGDNISGVDGTINALTQR